MSAYPRPTKIVGNCSVFEVDEDNLRITKDNIKLYSRFCLARDVFSINYLSKGGNGEIFNIVLDELDFVLKKQRITLGKDFKDLEKEVSLTDMLADVRRRDGQRISIPTYDCFFICKRGTIRGTNLDSCSGHMYYIMEKGIESNYQLILNKNGIFESSESKVVLIRDMLIKMIENIDLLVETRNIVWWDIKPGNSVYNFKRNVTTHIAEINPIIIDLDEKYLTDSFEKLVDLTKLNYFLGNLKFEGDNVFPFILDEGHLKRLYSFLMTLSFIHQFMDSFSRNRRRAGDVIFRMVLGLSIFIKRTVGDDETITPFDILRIILNPRREDLWINVATQLLLRTRYVDSDVDDTKSDDFRITFFHYNANGIGGNIESKYDYFYTKLLDYYTIGRTYTGEDSIFKNTIIRMPDIISVKGRMEEGDNLETYLDSIGVRPEESSNNSFNKISLTDVPSQREIEKSEALTRQSRGFLRNFLGF
jgi:hypothetical protein